MENRSWLCMHLLCAQHSHRCFPCTNSFTSQTNLVRKIALSSDFTERAEDQRVQVPCSKSHGPWKVKPGFKLSSRAPEFMLLTTRLLCCKGIQHFNCEAFSPGVIVKFTVKFIFPLYFKPILTCKYLKLALIVPKTFVSSLNRTLWPRLK